jgi:membrane-bound ClpP family serine protease
MLNIFPDATGCPAESRPAELRPEDAPIGTSDCPVAARHVAARLVGGRLVRWVLIFVALMATGRTAAQTQDDPSQPAGDPAATAADESPQPAVADQASSAENPRTAYRIDVPLPIDAAVAERVCGQLEKLAATVGNQSGRRIPVVLEFSSEESKRGGSADQDGGTPLAGRGSRFEHSLAIARCLTSRSTRTLRTVAYLRGDVRGHAVLVVLACDEFVVDPNATLGDAVADESDVDPTVTGVYQSISALRGVIPSAAVTAMVSGDEGLYRVTEVGGAQRFIGQPEALRLRNEGAAWKEEKLADPGTAAVFNAQQLRNYRWASQTIDRPDSLAGQLDVAKIVSPNEISVDVQAVRMELLGPVAAGRVRRFRSNLNAAFDSGTANSVFLEIDSPGGDLNSSIELGLELASLSAEGGQAIGFVSGQVLGDATMVALACKPLYMHPEARLGGDGAEALSHQQILELREAIEAVAERSGRPSALLIGLLDTSVEVRRYTQRRTGEIGFFTADQLDEDAMQQWERGPIIELADGLSTAQAIELGLVEGEADSPLLAARRAGLSQLPPPLADRRIVHAVEWLGGLPWLGPLLLFVGFMAFSMEASAPGLGIPGFVSLVCFMFFFWMKFLSGTAEWLEIVLFAGGVVCVLIEVLIVPGVGVFGIGGLLMIISAIVLTSQTFVIPQNTYQYQQTARGLFTVVASTLGVMMGFVALRFLLPGTPMFRHLVMPGPNSDEMIEQEQREHLVHYDALVGKRGLAVTPLRPAGKAQFGDQIVAVISDGALLERGAAVRVLQVQGNRIVVEPV